MRRMRSARRVINEERTVRCYRFLFADVINDLVRQRIIERVATLHAFWNFHLDWCGVTIEGRGPLVRLTTDEAVKMIEPLAARPSVKRTGDTGLPIGNVMIFADEGSAIPVLA